MSIVNKENKRVATISMHYYMRGKQPCVRLYATYDDGEQETLCDTELDAEVIHVHLVREASSVN